MLNKRENPNKNYSNFLIKEIASFFFQEAIFREFIFVREGKIACYAEIWIEFHFMMYILLWIKYQNFRLFHSLFLSIVTRNVKRRHDDLLMIPFLVNNIFFRRNVQRQRNEQNSVEIYWPCYLINLERIFRAIFLGLTKLFLTLMFFVVACWRELKLNWPFKFFQ